MGYQLTFKRKEVKYLINEHERAELQVLLDKYMRPDEHGRSLLCNLYLDTPSNQLIRRSLEHPVYKEKLRLRTYGVAGAHTPAFVEIKKKYRGVVYKRRVASTYSDAMASLVEGRAPGEGQVANEINYMLQHYDHLAPMMYLAYEREAYFGKTNRDFRMTFDTNIVARAADLSLTVAPSGEELLPAGHMLMEVKTAGGMPLWLTSFLSEHGLRKTAFSKYGLAYTNQLAARGGEVGEREPALVGAASPFGAFSSQPAFGM